MAESHVTILGAGPAGLTAAIFLGKNRIPVTLIDKDHFPRDKICGDCLGGYAISVISQMGDNTFDRFASFAEKLECGGVHLFGPEHQQVSIPAVNMVRDRMHEVVLSRRKDFDSFLLEEARQYPDIRFVDGIKITAIKKDKSGFHMTNENNFHHRTDMLVLATGSVRHLCRQLTGEKASTDHYATGIRTYFENVEGWNEKAFIELHFLKDLAPGYLWLFPLPGGVFNVGLGLQTGVLKKKKIDLKEYFVHLLQESSYFRKRFQRAKQLEEIKGFPLALGGNFRSLSGEGYLLTGDAGHLIEPLFGEGIGHAMYSGKFAAEHVIKALEKSDFSASFNREYDRKVYEKLGTALKFSLWMNKVARYPHLMRFLFNRVDRNEVLREQVFSIINGHTPKTPFHGIGLISRLLLGR